MKWEEIKEKSPWKRRTEKWKEEKQVYNEKTNEMMKDSQSYKMQWKML